MPEAGYLSLTFRAEAMYHMVPRGMVGHKCHPPLSTVAEVWRPAAGVSLREAVLKGN